ncbi:arylsulfatase [Haloplanus vescus]|uniref:Arylsulfatase n=1 Tax=Haloplanus vescus TaxID=555874 RepID=A0A1H4AQE9_9EURY|nr:sulfatase-like hydrolase/transferase [Haloplanus vescus]SEA38126.1 arylsulfatase [Haloplanus vescus]
MIDTPPNVLLLILDSARARNTSLHGYHRETTPFLEEFASSATTYTQARAPAGRSLPSHASIFSGYLPQEHGINDLENKLEREANVFARLADNGYDTGLFTDNPYLTDLDTGLSSGFETVFNDRDLYEDGESPSAFVEEESLDKVEFLTRALRSDAPIKSLANGVSWMLKWRYPRLAPEGTVFSRGFTYAERFAQWRTDRKGPWAACINLMDTHVPFRPGEEYDRWATSDGKNAQNRTDMENIGDDERWKFALLEDRYDGTIRQADAVVEQILTALKEDRELSNTYVVVTADHGEGFGERSPIDDHPSIGHGDAVDEPLLHVPLVVKEPGQSKGRTVSEPVGIVDTPVAIERATTGDVDGPSFVTDRTVFAGGFEDGDPIDAAYGSHESHGVRKYVQNGSESWSVHVPTPRDAYCLDAEIPPAIESEIDALSPANVTQAAESEVTESVEQTLSALGYTE